LLIQRDRIFLNIGTRAWCLYHIQFNEIRTGQQRSRHFLTRMSDNLSAVIETNFKSTSSGKVDGSECDRASGEIGTSIDDIKEFRSTWSPSWSNKRNQIDRRTASSGSDSEVEREEKYLTHRTRSRHRWRWSDDFTTRTWWRWYHYRWWQWWSLLIQCDGIFLNIRTSTRGLDHIKFNQIRTRH